MKRCTIALCHELVQLPLRIPLHFRVTGEGGVRADQAMPGQCRCCGEKPGLELADRYHHMHKGRRDIGTQLLTELHGAIIIRIKDQQHSPTIDDARTLQLDRPAKHVALDHLASPNTMWRSDHYLMPVVDLAGYPAQQDR